MLRGHLVKRSRLTIVELANVRLLEPLMEHAQIILGHPRKRERHAPIVAPGSAPHHPGVAIAAKTVRNARSAATGKIVL